jgi:DNA-binding MarR family transcriptional regulator
MMVLWDKKSINVKSLGEILYLDSRTLTPLLKKLESKNYIERKRSASDERNVIISITKEGEALKKDAKKIPSNVSKCVNLSKEEAMVLYKLLYKVLDNISQE